jgi:hypothetical protein
MSRLPIPNTPLVALASAKPTRHIDHTIPREAYVTPILILAAVGAYSEEHFVMAA